MSDEKKLEAWAEFGAPEVLGLKASVGVRYQQTWHERGTEYRDDVAGAAALALHDLEARLENNAALRDVFANGANRIVHVDDQSYRRTIARAVARAFADDAKIDEISYLCRELEQLEPVHLRVLDAFKRRIESSRTLAKHLSASEGLMEAALRRLASSAFIEQIDEELDVDPETNTASPTAPRPRWQLSAWGRAALRFVRDESSDKRPPAAGA